MDPTTLFKALADPTRLRLALLLQGGEERCVCELTAILDLPQPKVSHHLAALRKVGLVSDRKEGLWVHYRLSQGLAPWVRELLRVSAQGVGGEAPYASDNAALANSLGTAACPKPAK